MAVSNFMGIIGYIYDMPIVLAKNQGNRLKYNRQQSTLTINDQ